MIPQQTVLLAGGTGSRLYPLNSTGTPKALLPVGNEPLISFPLKSLEEAGIREVFVVCFGEGTASKVQSWITKHYNGNLHLTVKSIPDDSSGSHTAGALRAVATKLTSDTFVVVSGDLVTDIPLKALLASHYVTSATCTSLFTRRTSAAAETKPGKAPSNVDYVGLHQDGKQLLFFDTSGEVAKHSIRVPVASLAQEDSLTIQTDLVDQHCYVFDRRAVFKALDAKPTIAAIKEDLLPYLVRHQRPLLKMMERENSLASSLGAENLAHGLSWSLGHRAGWWAGAFIAPASNYCRRANTLAAYADVNREVTGTELASKFISLKPNIEGYFRHDSVTVAPRSTIAAGCMIGKGGKIGERCTIKRSVLGTNCSLGSNVKLINSVLMDRVVVEDGCTVQNCILCSGSHVQAHAQLRDCQVGPEYTVTESSEHRGETLDKAKRIA